MAVSMDDIKKLRDLTNAGMMDCKNSLEQTNGNIDEALKILKEKGLADAKKRSDRETKEGGVYIKENNNKIAIALIGCETDFVARNDIFVETKDKILDKILETKNEDVNSYNDLIQDAISQIKENIELKQIKYLEIKDNQYSSIYIHGNNKIGVVTIFELSDTSIKDNSKFKEFANNICLHITANSPLYISSEDVPEKDIAEQKDIISKQMGDSNKPKEILEKIINGKISKFFTEVCLLEQKYVKDDKITVKKLIENTIKELNIEFKVIDFIRYMIGK
jgi:elongation factor Ts